MSSTGLTLNNDLGLRAIMPDQMVLALFARYYLAHLTRQHRWLLTLVGPLILLGVASSVWEITAMGLSKYQAAPLIPPNVLQSFQQIPEVTPPSPPSTIATTTTFPGCSPATAIVSTATPPARPSSSTIMPWIWPWPLS